MTQINYKNFDKDFFKEEYEDLFDFKEELLAIVKENGDRLYYLYTDAWSWMVLKYLNEEQETDKIKSNIKYAMQGIYGHIKTLTNFGQPTKVPVGEEEVELVNENNSFDTVFDLWGAYVRASICRNKDVIGLLSTQNDSALFFRDGIHNASSAYKILKLFQNEDVATKKVFEDYRAAVRARIQTAEEKEYGEMVSEYLMELYSAYFFTNEKAFNEALQIALDKNLEYYDTEKGNRCREIENWLPWTYIFIACKAHDKGWQITVDDPRLPMAFVMGKYNVPSVF